MKKSVMKKVFMLTLACLFVLSAASCGAKSPSVKQTPSPTNSAAVSSTPVPTDNASSEADNDLGGDQSYEGAYNRSYTVISAFSDKMQSIIDSYNTEEEEDSKTTNNTIDISGASLAFMDLNRAFTATLNEGIDEAALNTGLSALGLENIIFKKNAANDYTLSFESASPLDGSKQSIKMDCKYDPDTDSMRYVCNTTSGGKTATTFFEFIPLDDSVYALQNEHERAIITMDGEEISKFIYSSNRGDGGLFGTDDKAILYDLNSDSIFKKTTGIDEKWVSGNRNSLDSIYSFDGSKLTVELCTSNSSGTKWTWQDPVVITPQA